MPQQTIYTNTANCQDCYRCVRECPVKAIRISEGQANVEDKLCIKCGDCVRECPQNAKTVRSDLDAAKSLLASGGFTAVSIAPAFAALFTDALSRCLPSALRQLGFNFVGETAEGAKYVTDQTFITDQEQSGYRRLVASEAIEKLPKQFPIAQGSICTACPAVVNYVEKYRPHYLDVLIPVVSPMVAHGRMIKEKHPGCSVIFVGPCAAKKQEAERPENKDAVDIVLTFIELLEWFSSEKIVLEECSESNFDHFYEIGDARLFPIQGGMLKAGNIQNDGTQLDILHVSGAEDVMDLFDEQHDFHGMIIEPLFCKGGCIGGPCFGSEHTINPKKSLFARREQVIKYAQNAVKSNKPPMERNIVHKADFSWDEQTHDNVTENQINKILERTGKINPANQLNCGACGYESCVHNAAAVARGMAEPEMCIPFMRQLAQQRTDRIIETTPNGIVMLDNELCMIKMNPSFQKMFMCNNGILGRRISYLVNAEGFEKLQSGEVDKYESIQFKYGKKYHEILYALREEEQYVGIYADISKIKYDEKQMDAIKVQTLMHAREFLDHQVRFAQEMAHYLGKSTAQSEEIAMRLINLYEENGGETL